MSKPAASRGGGAKNASTSYNASKKAAFYEEHLSKSALEDLMAAGKAISGVLKVIPTMRKKSFVLCDGLESNILIEDEKWRNRAYVGDTVVVELFDEDLGESTTGGGGGGGGGGGSNSAAEFDEDLSCLRIPSGSPRGGGSVPPSPDGTADQEEDEIEKTGKLWKPKHDLLEKFNATGTAIVSEVCQDINSRYNSRQPRGKVIGILESNHNITVVGRLYPMNEVPLGTKLPPNQSKVYFEPNNKSYPNLIILRDDLPEAYIDDPNAMATKIYAVDLESQWSAESKLPLGRKVRSLGEMGFILPETEALLLENNLPHSEFTLSMMKSLEIVLGVSGLEPETRVVDWTIPADEISKRLDLRHKRIFTIDPTTAKDLDDAVHVEPLEDGTFEVGVHIADVSYFLREDNELDKEAQRRATSVYLVQKVLPMLPPLLSENLCSLNPNVDRLAFSCIFKMNADGTLIDGEEPFFGRTVIRSCAKLDYVTAQRMIDGLIPDHPFTSEEKECDPDFEIKALPEDIWSARRKPIGHFGWECSRDVKMLNQIASSRRSVRLEKGSLQISTDKLTFSLNADGNPTSVGKYQIRKSNNLIEEYMLLANYFVAEKLIDCVGGAAFIRNHKAPDFEVLKANLEEFTVRSGIPVSFESLSEFKETMLEVTTADQVTRSCIGALMMRALPRAEYLTAFTAPSGSWKHYGLNIPYYTHFTSPIRRYADVMVHRLLDISLGPSESAQKTVVRSEKYLRDSQSIARRCNDMKNNARSAQLRSDAVFMAVYLMNSPQIVSGKIIGLGEKYFWVYDNEYGVMKRIFNDKIPGVDVRYNNLNNTLILTRRAVAISGSSSGGPETPDVCELEQESVTIGMMSNVKLKLSASDIPPIDVVVSIMNSDWNNESESSLAEGVSGQHRDSESGDSLSAISIDNA